MKLHALLSLGLFVALISLPACKKDDVKPQAIFEKKGQLMSGDQEVPVKVSPASGTLDATYNKDTKILLLYATWTGLTGTPIGAHIHGTAPKGTNAGVKSDFHDEVTTVSGNFTKSVTVDNIAIKEDSLLAGFYYFNIHTPTNPGGEIRGQIEFK